ncbi:MAG: HlyD family efflux transporter periplasmic adaptor subunit [Myxococcota bacterium]
MSAPASRPSERTVLDRIHPDNPASGRSSLTRIRPPASLRLAAIVLAVALPVIAILALVVPWQQSAFATGRVIAFAPQEREQLVEAPISGRIQEWYVQEGQQVTAGTPLVELRDNAPDLMLRLQEQRLATLAERDATEAQIASYERKLDASYASRDRAVAEAEAKIQGTLQKRAGEAAEAETAGLNASRVQILSSEGIASTRDQELAQMSLRKAQAALDARDREISALRQSLEKTRAEADQKIESTRAELEAARSKLSEVRRKLVDLDVKVSRQAAQVVVAPRDGTVFRLHGGLGGGQIKAGDPVVTLVPATDSRAVELWLDGNDMPFVSDHADVRLVFEGWPALQFVGLHGASQGTFAGQVAFVDATDDGGKFRVVVVPAPGAEWPDGHLLRQGVRVKGFLLLGQVPLGFEVWRQINGFPPKPSIEKGTTTALPSAKKPRTPPALK